MNNPQVLLNKPAPGTRLDLSHPLNKGLVGCWLFNEQSGMQAYDLSPYHNHGTLVDFNDPSSKDRSSLGLQFDGTSSYVDCGNDPSLNITNAITIEAWAKSDVSQSGGLVVFVGHGETYALSFDHSEVDYRGALFFKSGSTWYNSDGPVIVSKDVWHQVVGVYDETYIRFYLDGVEQTNRNVGSLTINTTDSEDLRIGDSNNNAYFDGMIDNVMIYNRALSAEEIKKLYQEPYCMFERGEL